MQIRVNGERRELRDESRLSDLLKELSLAPERVAVELNHQVVRRNEWPNTILNEGDRLEIVHFVGGGSSSLYDLSEALLQIKGLNHGSARFLTAKRLRPPAQDWPLRLP